MSYDKFITTLCLGEQIDSLRSDLKTMEERLIKKIDTIGIGQVVRATFPGKSKSKQCLSFKEGDLSRQNKC